MSDSKREDNVVPPVEIKGDVRDGVIQALLDRESNHTLIEKLSANLLKWAQAERIALPSELIGLLKAEPGLKLGVLRQQVAPAKSEIPKQLRSVAAKAGVVLTDVQLEKALRFIDAMCDIATA